MKKVSIYDQMTKSEKEVADLLKEMGIKWTYEQPVFVWDENKRPRVWAPDFYLTSFGVYIEVCGSEKFDNGYRVIFLHLFKETDKWKNHLTRDLVRFTDYRYKKLNEILQKENKIFSRISIPRF